MSLNKLISVLTTINNTTQKMETVKQEIKSKIRLIILRILLFIVGNLLLLWFHIWIFKCPFPHIVWLTIIIHIIGLIYFPYKKFII